MTDRPSMPARCRLLAAMFLPAALAGCSAPGAAALRTPPPYRLFDVDRGLSCAAAAASFRFAVVRAARLEDWLAAGPLPSYGLDRFGTDAPAQLEDERGRLDALVDLQRIKGCPVEDPVAAVAAERARSPAPAVLRRLG